MDVGVGPHQGGPDALGRWRRTGSTARSAGPVTLLGASRARPGCGSACLAGQCGLHPATTASTAWPAGVFRPGCVHGAGEVALKDACAAASCPGWRGRATRRRKPRRRSTSLMLRSASTMPNRTLITRARSARRQHTTPRRARSGPWRTHPATSASLLGRLQRARRRRHAGQTVRPGPPRRNGAPRRAASAGPCQPPAPLPSAACLPGSTPRPACVGPLPHPGSGSPHGAALPHPAPSERSRSPPSSRPPPSPNGSGSRTT